MENPNDRKSESGSSPFLKLSAKDADAGFKKNLYSKSKSNKNNGADSARINILPGSALYESTCAAVKPLLGTAKSVEATIRYKAYDPSYEGCLASAGSVVIDACGESLMLQELCPNAASGSAQYRSLAKKAYADISSIIEKTSGGAYSASENKSIEISVSYDDLGTPQWRTPTVKKISVEMKMPWSTRRSYKLYGGMVIVDVYASKSNAVVVETVYSKFDVSPLCSYAGMPEWMPSMANYPYSISISGESVMTLKRISDAVSEALEKEKAAQSGEYDRIIAECSAAKLKDKK